MHTCLTSHQPNALYAPYAHLGPYNAHSGPTKMQSTMHTQGHQCNLNCHTHTHSGPSKHKKVRRKGGERQHRSPLDFQHSHQGQQQQQQQVQRHPSPPPYHLQYSASHAQQDPPLPHQGVRLPGSVFKPPEQHQTPQQPHNRHPQLLDPYHSLLQHTEHYGSLGLAGSKPSPSLLSPTLDDMARLFPSMNVMLQSEGKARQQQQQQASEGSKHFQGQPLDRSPQHQPQGQQQQELTSLTSKASSQAVKPNAISSWYAPGHIRSSLGSSGKNREELGGHRVGLGVLSVGTEEGLLA